MTDSKPTQEITFTVPVTFHIDKHDLTQVNSSIYSGLDTPDEKNIAGYVLDHLNTEAIAQYIRIALESYEGKDILIDALRETEVVGDALPDGYEEAHDADSREYEEWLEAYANGLDDALSDEPGHVERLDAALANA